MSSKFNGATVTLSMELYEAILARVKHEPGCEVTERHTEPGIVHGTPIKCSCGATQIGSLGWGAMLGQEITEEEIDAVLGCEQGG